MSSMFTITDHKGYRMTFANGWAISVQWGPGNYCEQQDYGSMDAPARTDHWSSITAECAVFDPQDRMVQLGEFDSVRGWMTADEVAALMHSVATGTFVEAEPLTVGVISDKTAEVSPEVVAELVAMPGVQVDRLMDENGGMWGEHHTYTPADWRYAVANGDTRAGYWSWVAAQLEQQLEQQEETA